MTNSRDSKEPVAGLAAASSCIRVSLSSPPFTIRTRNDIVLRGKNIARSFRPVYTHQFFEQECIPGWRPLLQAEQQSQHIYQSWNENRDNNSKDKELHSSYQYCCRDQPKKEGRIDIHVLLSPSCENCNIEIQTETVPTRTSNNSDHVNEPTQKKAKRVSFEGVADDDAQENTQQKQMNIKDIVQYVSSAVPPIVSVRVNGTVKNQWLPAGEGGTNTDNDTASLKNGTSGGGMGSGYITRLVGQTLKTYSRKIKDGSIGCDGDESTEESKFVITMANGSDPDVARYHNSIQPLARWFIETADDVDLTDDSRGSWKVMYLFRCHDNDGAASSPPSPAYSLAGYITLLHVHSPFRKPPGIIVRVCQALILPPYHRLGHGSVLLRSLYAYAESSNDATHTSSLPGMDILEINVEDPAPAFVALRASVDYQRFSSIVFATSDNKSNKLNLNYLEEYDVTNKEYFLPVSEDNLLSVAQVLKITKRQAQIVYEIFKLYQVEQWKEQHSCSYNKEEEGELIRLVETNYRLMVKKSLRSLRMEELGACEGGKEGQKALLGQWFDDTFCHYRRLLGLKS